MSKDAKAAAPKKPREMKVDEIVLELARLVADGVRRGAIPDIDDPLTSVEDGPNERISALVAQLIVRGTRAGGSTITELRLQLAQKAAQAAHLSLELERAERALAEAEARKAALEARLRHAANEAAGLV